MNPRFDALVVGGGPAGSTAAILLARAGWKVALVEKSAFPRRKVCGEFISETTWPLLRELGVADELLARAGPPVRRVGIYAGAQMPSAELASAAQAAGGRAIGREHLDTALLAAARRAGAQVWQPFRLSAFSDRGDRYACELCGRDPGHTPERLDCRVLIAAHGSWEPGVLPTNPVRRRAAGADLFGFKAHFRGGSLPIDLMPLIAFPGGYGGMVHSDDGRTSLSCCIRRDALSACRRQHPHCSAGAAVLAHIVAANKGVATVLESAREDGAWLSAGPLRTGIRSFGTGAIFPVGNAAAEAHPIVAEGISMAVQSAALLCQLLTAGAQAPPPRAACAAIRQAYEAAWRKNFSGRLRLAAALAQLFMRPATAALATRAGMIAPALLTIGSRWSGKARALRPAAVA